MPPWIIAVFQWLGKFTPRYAFVIALLTGVLLFESSKTLKYFNLDTLAHTYRGIIALIFIASVLLLASYPVSIAGNWVVNGINRHRVRRVIKKNLESLGSDQVALLMQYAQSGKSTILIPFHKTAIAEDLLEKGILYRPAQIGNAMDGIGYSITSEAAPFLRYKAFQKILLRGVKKQL
jgi:hypothetical protein